VPQELFSVALTPFVLIFILPQVCVRARLVCVPVGLCVHVRMATRVRV
jgi:hypothetical protein